MTVIDGGSMTGRKQRKSEWVSSAMRHAVFFVAVFSAALLGPLRVGGQVGPPIDPMLDSTEVADTAIHYPFDPALLPAFDTTYAPYEFRPINNLLWD